MHSHHIGSRLRLAASIVLPAATSAGAQALFTQSFILSGAERPVTTIAVDLNGDGKPDVVTAKIFVQISLNQGGGNFGAQVALTQTHVGGSDVTVGDVNGDGIPDIVTTDTTAMWVLLGTGHGAFAASPTQIATVAAGRVKALVDVTGDGVLDAVGVVTGGGATPLVWTMIGNGDGTFQAPVVSDVSGTVIDDMEMADLNNDGRLDVVVTHSAQSTIEILLNDGGGLFTSHTTFAANVPRTVAVADFNGDGMQDVVIGVV